MSRRKEKGAMSSEKLTLAMEIEDEDKCVENKLHIDGMRDLVFGLLFILSIGFMIEPQLSSKGSKIALRRVIPLFHIAPNINENSKAFIHSRNEAMRRNNGI
ncbi:hypothetical protein DVH24_002784 [Malus domestica]|uniref:Transmembrane protein n=1 Tax=Malus domestica TaxID=3750 RepID=A0A498K5P8_MALDO|nr:hypothetical protein DVH24_002784 [Malus domestica]